MLTKKDYITIAQVLNRAYNSAMLNWEEGDKTVDFMEALIKQMADALKAERQKQRAKNPNLFDFDYPRFVNACKK